MRDIKFWLIIGLVAIIILGIIFWPKPHDSNKAQYLDTLSFLRAKEASIIAQGQRIIKTYEDALKSDSLSLAAKDALIRQAKAKVVIRRVFIEPLADSIPELRSFIQGQDSVILIQGQTIDTLKQSLAFSKQTFNDLVVNHNAEESIEARIEMEKDDRIENLEKQNRRKNNKGVKFWKVATVVSLIGGFFLGSQ